MMDNIILMLYMIVTTGQIVFLFYYLRKLDEEVRGRLTLKGRREVDLEEDSAVVVNEPFRSEGHYNQDV